MECLLFTCSGDPPPSSPGQIYSVIRVHIVCSSMINDHEYEIEIMHKLLTYLWQISQSIQQFKWFTHNQNICIYQHNTAGQLRPIACGKPCTFFLLIKVKCLCLIDSIKLYAVIACCCFKPIQNWSNTSYQRNQS